MKSFLIHTENKLEGQIYSSKKVSFRRPSEIRVVSLKSTTSSPRQKYGYGSEELIDIPAIGEAVLYEVPLRNLERHLSNYNWRANAPCSILKVSLESIVPFSFDKVHIKTKKLPHFLPLQCFFSLTHREVLGAAKAALEGLPVLFKQFGGFCVESNLLYRLSEDDWRVWVSSDPYSDAINSVCPIPSETTLMKQIHDLLLAKSQSTLDNCRFLSEIVSKTSIKQVINVIDIRQQISKHKKPQSETLLASKNDCSELSIDASEAGSSLGLKFRSNRLHKKKTKQNMTFIKEMVSTSTESVSNILEQVSPRTYKPNPMAVSNDKDSDDLRSTSSFSEENKEKEPNFEENARIMLGFGWKVMQNLKQATEDEQMLTSFIQGNDADYAVPRSSLELLDKLDVNMAKSFILNGEDIF